MHSIVQLQPQNDFFRCLAFLHLLAQQIFIKSAYRARNQKVLVLKISVFSAFTRHKNLNEGLKEASILYLQIMCNEDLKNLSS